MTEPKDSHSSNSDKICTVHFITGKVETSGSTFSNETPLGGCLHPYATIDKSILILNVPSYMLESKDSHSSNSDKICTVDFITGKVETSGSTFSNETPQVAACVLMLL